MADPQIQHQESEPESCQEKQNASPSTVRLLDDEDSISELLESCLQHIFSKYCTPAPSITQPVQSETRLLTPPDGAYLTPEGLDEWARDTNGAPFSPEMKEELVEFLDVTDDGQLTFKGFMQLYQLQTENDEDETWRDLSKHGFDQTLTLIN